MARCLRLSVAVRNERRSRTGSLKSTGRDLTGGVTGRSLELTSLDDGYEPDLAAANADRFVAENDVVAVIGAVSVGAFLLGGLGSIVLLMLFF